MATWENAFGEIATAAKQDTQQTTLAAIQTATDALLIAANAIKVAAEALNTKTTTINTGAIVGTVALDAPTLAALETTGVAVSNFPATQPISGTVALDAGTLAALETTGVAVSNFPATQPISGTVALDAPTLAALENTTATIANFPATQPISAASLPLPTGAATETTLAALSAKVPALDSGRLPVSLPPGGSGLTNSELRATPVPVSGTFSASPPDDSQGFTQLFGAMRAPMYIDRATGRLRITIEAGTLPAVTAVGTVTTVTTLSSLTNIVSVGSISATVAVRAAMNTAREIQSQNIYG